MLAERPAWCSPPLPPAHHPRSQLQVSRCEYLLGSSEPLVLRWELSREAELSPTDWIGLYRTDEVDASCYIECKTRWPNASSRGQILWTIERLDLFTDDVTNVCFKYFHGSSGALRAVSPVVTVRRAAPSGPQSSHAPEEVLVGYSGQQFPVEMVKFTLSKVCARGLKRGLLFSPDPYLKMSVQPGRGEGVLLLPHHGQLCRSPVALATTHPCWPGQFEFIAYPSDLLEFEVKDKFAKSRPIISRFLGKFSIQICFLLDQCNGVPIEFCFSLCSKNPSDHVSGQLLFTFTLENEPVDPWTHIRQVHNPIYATDITSSDSQIPQHLPPEAPPVPPTTPPRPPSIAAATTNGGRQQRDSPNPPPVRRNTDTPVMEMNGVVPAASRRREAEPTSAGRSSSETPPAAANCGRKTPVMRSSQRSMGDLNLDAANPPVPQPARRDSNVETSSVVLRRDVEVPPSNGRRRDSEGVVAPPVLRRPATADSEVPPPPTNSNNAARPRSVAPSEVAPEPPRRQSKAFTNMEYVLHPVEDEAPPPPPEDVPPPLPPKQKGHRPLERARGSLAEGGSVDGAAAASQANGAATKPEDSFLLEIVDTDERDGGDAREEETSSSEEDREGEAREGVVVPPSPPRRTSSGVACRPNALPLKAAQQQQQQQDSGTAPLATPEHCDSLHEGCSLENLPQQETYLSLSSCEPPGSYPGSPESTLSDSMEDNAQDEEDEEEREAVVMRESTSSLSLLSTPDSVPVSPGLVVSPTSSSSTSTEDHPLRRNSLGPMVGGRSLSFCGPREHLTLPQHLPVAARLPSIPERTIRYQRVNPEEPLPPHWEARIDSHGRVFYIDHLNRTTTWSKPSTSSHQQLLTLGTASELQRQQLDRRYQSIRRTMTSRPSSSSGSGGMGEEGGGVGASEGQRMLLLRSPPVCFLTRPDFLNVLHMNDDALAVYNRSSSLKHMIMKIRRDPSGFERYQHNRDLVSLLNKFADSTRELPRGWETKLDRAGKQFFIDHTSRSTTFIDPRLPTEAPPLDPNKLPLPPPGGRRRSRSAGEEEIRPDTSAAAAAAACSPPVQQPVPPPRPPSGGASGGVPVVSHVVPTAYNDKVVAFLRQPNIVDILRERHPAVASSAALRDKVAAVRQDGTQAIERFSCDVDLTILLSLFEQEIMSYIPAQFSSSSNGGRSPRTSPQPSPQASPGLQRANVRAPAPYRRDFEAKLRNFYRKLESKGFGQGPGKLKLNIRRDHLLEDAFTKIMAASKKDLQKSRLYISFAGEEGLDYGGPSREFFFLLSRELFNPYYGLFEYSANDTYTVQVSPMSAFVDNAHEWFRFSGRVLGLALVHQYLLDAFFTRPFYKAMLRLPCSLSDLEYLDAEFHQSLLWLKEHDISETGLELTFCVTEEVAGQVVERELRAGGKATPVSERNKKEYIERMLRWRLERGVQEQTESLVKGFYEVVDPRLVSVFDARELELVIAGTAEIDICDWRKNTDYRSGYHDSHPVIEWFWAAIGKFDNERRLRLLQFVTGTSSVPYEGFAALRGSNGPRKFCIEKWGKPTSLPRAHTCFNRLDLPPYTTYDMLYEKLLLAVEESSTFGIE